MLQLISFQECISKIRLEFRTIEDPFLRSEAKKRTYFKKFREPLISIVRGLILKIKEFSLLKKFMR